MGIIRLNNFIELDPNERGSRIYVRRQDALSSEFSGPTTTTIRYVLDFPLAQAGGMLLARTVLMPSDDHISQKESP